MKLDMRYFYLGIIAEYGLYNEKKDYQAALKLYQKGAELNEPYCLYRLYYIQKNHCK